MYQSIANLFYTLISQSRNKLDGNLYAVKKVKFKHSKPEVWYKVSDVFRKILPFMFLKGNCICFQPHPGGSVVRVSDS